MTQAKRWLQRLHATAGVISARVTVTTLLLTLTETETCVGNNALEGWCMTVGFLSGVERSYTKPDIDADEIGTEVRPMQTNRGCRARLEGYLRENGVEYVLEHHPVAYTARDVAASEHVAATRIAKSVMVLADEHLAMVVLPGSEHLYIPALPGALGAHHVRLAQESEFGPAFPDCEVGAMPPFGNLYGVPVYVDASLVEYETIRFEAGTYTDTLCIKYADFMRLVNPTVVDVGHPQEASSVLV